MELFLSPLPIGYIFRSLFVLREYVLPLVRSHNFEKVTHIKGRLLYQAIILYNYAPFRNEFSKRKVFAPKGSEYFRLRAVTLGMENHFYHIR